MCNGERPIGAAKGNLECGGRPPPLPFPSHQRLGGGSGVVHGLGGCETRPLRGGPSAGNQRLSVVLIHLCPRPPLCSGVRFRLPQHIPCPSLFLSASISQETAAPPGATALFLWDAQRHGTRSTPGYVGRPAPLLPNSVPRHGHRHGPLEEKGRGRTEAPGLPTTGRPKQLWTPTANRM